MRAVRISWKTAQALLAAVDRLDDIDQGLIVGQRLAQDALRQAMAPKRSVKAHRTTKAKKDKTKQEKTSAVRRAVWARADERCEACGDPGSGFNPLDLEHFFRRVNGESLEECWLTCRRCHKAKHAGRPSVSWWLGRFIQHCEDHGYSGTAERARAKLHAAALIASAELAGARNV